MAERKAKANKAEKHHAPGRRLGDGGADTVEVNTAELRSVGAEADRGLRRCEKEDNLGRTLVNRREIERRRSREGPGTRVTGT